MNTEAKTVAVVDYGMGNLRSVSQAVQAYILSLVRNTRMLADGVPQGKRRLNFGASPRASLALFAAGRALAWLRGQDFLSPALVQELAPDVLRHRILPSYEAEAEAISTDAILDRILAKVPVP